ncbi:MAG: leucine-rich repeat domain-containing protein [Parachlamydiales bacterium]|nr:leucine-rich repeat domain-containing protein [Candidatus Acheromyda pituitae]
MSTFSTPSSLTQTSSFNNPYPMLYELFAHSSSDSISESREQINALPKEVRDKLFWNVWNLNHRPPESNYGEIHVLDNRAILLRAITNIARDAYTQLASPDRRHIAYAYNGHLTGQLLQELSLVADRPAFSFYHDRTPYGKLLSLLLLEEGSSQEEAAETIRSLPNDLKQTLFWNIWDIAERPPEAHFGETHALDSIPALRQAICRIVDHFADQIRTGNGQIKTELEDLLDIPKFDSVYAFQVLSILDEHLGHLSIEMDTLINEWFNEWSCWNPDPHAKEAIVHFINNPRQTVLDLSDAVFYSLPDIFHLEPFVSRLQELRASDCNLIILPDSLRALRSLVHLDLSRNPNLSLLPDSICQLASLKILKLDRCNFTVLPSSIVDLQALTHLYLAYNPSFEHSVLERLVQRSSPPKIDIFQSCSASSSQPSEDFSEIDSDVLKRLYSLQTLAQSNHNPFRALIQQFSLSSKVLSFDLDQLVKQYTDGNTEYSLVELSSFIDWAGIPFAEPSRAQFEEIISRHLDEQAEDAHTAVANRLMGLLASYFTAQRPKASIGSNQETILKEQFRRAYYGIIDADSDCVDQMLSQLETLVLDIVAEGDLGQNSNGNQMKLLQFTALALCKYRNSLLKQIIAKELPREEHATDIERDVAKLIAQEVGQNGEIYESGARFSGLVHDLSGKISLVRAKFWEEYKPMEYLLNDLRTYHGNHKGLRNQILSWASNRFDLEKLSPLVSEEPEGFAVIDGGNFTYPGLILFLDEIGIVHPR